MSIRGELLDLSSQAGTIEADKVESKAREIEAKKRNTLASKLVWEANARLGKRGAGDAIVLSLDDGGVAGLDVMPGLEGLDASKLKLMIVKGTSVAPADWRHATYSFIYRMPLPLTGLSWTKDHEVLGVDVSSLGEYCPEDKSGLSNRQTYEPILEGSEEFEFIQTVVPIFLEHGAVESRKSHLLKPFVNLADTATSE